MKDAPVIAIASGKGGTGKTTVSLNLALSAGEAVNLLDCDVEEPNCHLFLRPEWDVEEPFLIPKPFFDLEKCISCGRCKEACRFNAIALPAGKPMFFGELCHSCGGCALACPVDAIIDKEVDAGRIRCAKLGDIHFCDGLIKVGEVQAPPIIERVKELAVAGIPSILDAPPGTACPAVASLMDVDFALLVTEPTPFGYHDLALAIDMADGLGVPSAVFINRSDIGDDCIHRLCEEKGIPVFGEIPFDRSLAEAYSRGIPAVNAVPAYRQLFRELWKKLREAVK